MMTPTRIYTKTIEGPVSASDLPEPRNKPVPMVPPMAMNCTWRLLRPRSISLVWSRLSTDLSLPVACRVPPFTFVSAILISFLFSAARLLRTGRDTRSKQVQTVSPKYVAKTAQLKNTCDDTVNIQPRSSIYQHLIELLPLFHGLERADRVYAIEHWVGEQLHQQREHQRRHHGNRIAVPVHFHFEIQRRHIQRSSQ